MYKRLFIGLMITNIGFCYANSETFPVRLINKANYDIAVKITEDKSTLKVDKHKKTINGIFSNLEVNTYLLKALNGNNFYALNKNVSYNVSLHKEKVFLNYNNEITLNIKPDLKNGKIFSPISFSFEKQEPHELTLTEENGVIVVRRKNGNKVIAKSLW